MIFYANIQKSRFGTQQLEFQTRSAIDLKTVVSTLPELSCTEYNDVSSSCIDIINLESMSKYWQSIKDDLTSPERDYYKYKFGTSTIFIKMLDPETGVWTKNWTLYSQNQSLFYSRQIFIPISLYDATSDDYSFGVLELKVFS